MPYSRTMPTLAVLLPLVIAVLTVAWAYNATQEIIHIPEPLDRLVRSLSYPVAFCFHHIPQHHRERLQNFFGVSKSAEAESSEQNSEVGEDSVH